MTEKKSDFYAPVSVHGAFVRLDGDYRWMYDPNIRGEYCHGYHDGMADESELGREECERHELAFRQGFLKGIRMITMELEELPEYELIAHGFTEEDMEEDMEGECDEDRIEENNFACRAVALARLRDLAKTLRGKRDQYRASVEIALKGQCLKSYPCRAMFEVGHWHQAAYLRGMHHAVEFLVQEWESYIHLNSDLLDADYVMVATEIKQRWWSEVLDWRYDKRLIPPPRPLFPGEQTEQFQEKVVD